MGKTPWSKAQSSWLASHLPGWKATRGKVQGQQAISGPTPQSQFLTRVVADFYDAFPSQQWSEETTHGFESGAEYHADLLKCIVQWLNNRAREPGGAARSAVPKIKNNVTGRQLAMSACNSDIRAKAAAIREEDSELNSRTAWNFATTQVLAQLRETDPAALERLETQAKEIRKCAMRDWVEQDPDTLKEFVVHTAYAYIAEILRRIMPAFEKRMLITICEWSRMTGAAIYIAAVM